MENQTKETKQFIYPEKINSLNPVFYTITAEDVESKEGFEGCYQEFFIQIASVKIPLNDCLNHVLATSELAKQFIKMHERIEKMMQQQQRYFDAKRKSDLEASKKLEGKMRNLIEVCRPMKNALKKYNS